MVHCGKAVQQGADASSSPMPHRLVAGGLRRLRMLWWSPLVVEVRP